MKFLTMLCLLLLTLPELAAQSLADRQDRFNACLSGHADLQNRIHAERFQAQEQLVGIRESVQQLIHAHEVRIAGSMLEVNNLRSAVELSMQLRDLDAECDSIYAQLRERILAAAWTEGLCAEDLTFNSYQELFDNYLEELIRFDDHYASMYFASYLGFRSMLLIQAKLEEEWLERQGLVWKDPHPFDELPVQEEMYWSVLDPNWAISFREPEESLRKIQNIYSEGGATEKTKFKDIVLFILNNWDNIKEILAWLDEGVFYDCSPTVTARIKSDTRDVNVMQQLSPDVERRIYYQVGQRGVRADFRSTRTRIWGKAHLYKRKRNRFVKDKTQVVGIAYCTQQWNVCDDQAWPANGQPFQFAGVHRRGKAKFSERHPYALAIQRLNTEFINFPLFYNRALVDQVYLLGNGGCF